MDNKFQKYYQQVWDKIRRENPTYLDKVVDKLTQEIIDLWPLELEQNFFEWLNDTPLSDIKIYNLSIKEIFDVWSQTNSNFYKNNIHLALDYIHNYINYLENERAKEKYIILNIHKMPGYRLCDM